MATCFHSKQSILDGDGIHSPISYIYANETIRLAATGFIQSDGYKLAIDADTNKIYVLIDWSTPTWQALSGGAGSDTDAIHNNIASEISAITLKVSPIYSDKLIIEDAADTYNKKSITIGTIPVGGDVSGTVSSISLDIGSVNTPVLANNAVTFNKIQNVNTDILIGRDSSGSGSVTEISLASTLLFTGSNSIGRAEITGDISIPVGSNIASISAGSIVNADVNSSAAIALSKLQTITTDRLLGRDAVGTGEIEQLTVSGGLEFTGTGIQRSAISGDITITAGSNTAAITAGAIVNSDISSSAAISVSKLSSGANGQVLTIAGGTPTWSVPPSSTNYRFTFGSFDFLAPINSNWAINGYAPWSSDTINASLPVRRFDDTTEEGVGFGFTIPSGTTSLTFYIKSRAQSAPIGSVAVVPSLWRKTVGDNIAVSSWSSRLNMASLAFTTNTNFQYDSQTITLSALGLAAGNYVLFELTRNTGSVSDTLSGDWTVLEIIVECI